MRKVNVEELADGIGNGSRAAIARAITLVESTRPQHRAKAHELLKLIAEQNGADVMGLQYQGEWLIQMGIDTRMEMPMSFTLEKGV